MAPRPTPFDLVFSRTAETAFPRIRDALAESGRDPRDRDAFLLVRETVELIRELRPEEGIGEGIDQLAALAHHAFLQWLAGTLTLEVGAEGVVELLGAAMPPADGGDVPSAFYAQLPERRVWAQLAEDTPHEPLDGCFVHLAPEGAGAEAETLRVLGVFGMLPERQGFSVAEVEGPEPGVLARVDGTPLFAPALQGGERAGLYSLTGAEELLELGWRARRLAGRLSAEAE